MKRVILAIIIGLLALGFIGGVPTFSGSQTLRMTIDCSKMPVDDNALIRWAASQTGNQNVTIRRSESSITVTAKRSSYSPGNFENQIVPVMRTLGYAISGYSMDTLPSAVNSPNSK